MRTRIGTRLILGAGLTIALAFSLMAVVVVREHRSALTEELKRGANQLSETIKSSTYHDMLENRRDNLRRQIETIGRAGGDRAGPPVQQGRSDRVRLRSEGGRPGLRQGERGLRRLPRRRQAAGHPVLVHGTLAHLHGARRPAGSRDHQPDPEPALLLDRLLPRPRREAEGPRDPRYHRPPRGGGPPDRPEPGAAGGPRGPRHRPDEHHPLVAQPAPRPAAGGLPDGGDTPRRLGRPHHQHPLHGGPRAGRARPRLQPDDRPARRGPAPAHPGRQARIGGETGRGDRPRDQQPAHGRADATPPSSSSAARGTRRPRKTWRSSSARPSAAARSSRACSTSRGRPPRGGSPPT